MNNKHSPVVTDSFRQINGIGPAIEQRLHKAGVLTFAQLAALEPTEIAALVSDLAGMSAERIAEQDWPGQARKLVPEPAPSESQPSGALPGDRQYDASFTVKLLLNEDHSVRRTQVVDNRRKADEQWAGWDERRMVTFICQGAALRLPAVEPTSPVKAAAEPERAVAAMAEPVLVAASTTEVEPPPTVPVGLGGTLHLHDLETVPADTDHSRRVLRHGLSFSVRLSLDLAEVVLLNDDPLDYTAAIYAKSLDGGLRETVGEAHDTITPKESLTIFVPSKPLPQGTYRLEAVVTLALPSAEPDLRAYLEGGILHVH